MEHLSTFYVFCYSVVLITLILLLSYFLLKDTYNVDIQIYKNDEDEEGGISAHSVGPDIPLPPGVGRPINDWEPKYNRIKEYV